MALHRDIHWIGRQWAVTGHGMQLIDQKLQGFFDIEVIRLWDESLIASMHAKEWLNVADFDKGLAVARARFPQSTLPVTPRPEAVSAPAIKPLPPLPPVARPDAPKRDEPKSPLRSRRYTRRRHGRSLCYRRLYSQRPIPSSHSRRSQRISTCGSMAAPNSFVPGVSG
jgi:hypothetical protein